MNQITSETPETTNTARRLLDIAKDVEALVKREIGGPVYVLPAVGAGESFAVGCHSEDHRIRVVDFFALAGMPLLSTANHPFDADDPEFTGGHFMAFFGMVSK